MPPAIYWKPLRRSANTAFLQRWRELRKLHVEHGADVQIALSLGSSREGRKKRIAMKLRILLSDDHEIVRRGLCALLQRQEGWEVCGEASDGREALEMAKQLKPDVVIVD